MLITNIQRSSFHDGPGIRTTVFCKGCMLACPWCANPETISPYPERYFDASLCVRKEKSCICNNDCPVLQDISVKIGEATCVARAIAQFGNYYSNEELYSLLIKDAVYYEINGGITFSGGEPFLQLHKGIELLRQLQQRQIHLCVETSLFVPEEYFLAAFRYFNLFYVDLKILTKQECKIILNGEIDLFFKNLDRLFSITDQVVFRIPLVRDITATDKNFTEIAHVLKRYRPIRVEYFDIHTMAEKKYTLLNRKRPVFEKVSNEMRIMLENILSNLNMKSTYLRI